MQSIVAYRLEKGLASVPYIQPGAYRINGEVKVIESSPRPLIINETDVIERINEIRTWKYVNEDTGEELSLQELNELKQRKFEEFALGNDDFPTTRARLQYEMFICPWVSKPDDPVLTYEPVVIEFRGEAITTEHPFIKPMWKLSGNLEDTIFEYDTIGHIQHVVISCLEKAGFERVDKEIVPVPSGKAYVFPERALRTNNCVFPHDVRVYNQNGWESLNRVIIECDSKLDRRSVSRSANYNQLLELANLLEDSARKWTVAFVRRQEAIGPTDISFGELLSNLRALAASIGCIQSKAVTNPVYNTAVQQVNQLIVKVRDAAAKE